MKNQPLGFGQNKSMARWANLSTDEKMKEFMELIRSPYWHLLPEDIRIRIDQMFPKTAPDILSTAFAPLAQRKHSGS